VPLALARQSQIINNNQIRIDLISYSPSPIIIGSEAIISFEIFNTGTSVIKNFQIIAVDKYPFEVIGSNTITLPILNPGESYIYNINTRIQQNIKEDTYQFNLQYYSDLNNRYEAIPYDIPIKRLQRTVASTTITTEPEYISPGSTAFINVKIENNADFAMKDVEVKLNFSDNVPIAPYQTTSLKQIDTIVSKSSGTATFQIIALPDAEPNVYKLPLSITFNDELGNENTRQDYIGLVISKKPEYDLTLEDDPLVRGNKGKITVSISNIGPSNIKYLILEVIPTKYYAILNPPRTYIGHLEPDDYETAEFDIYPRMFGDISLKVKLEYKDDMNNPIEETKEIKVHVYSRTYAKMIGLIPNTLFRNILLIVFIIFVYLTYKNWRRTKNFTGSMKQSAISILTVALNVLRHIKWSYIKRIPRKIKIFFVKLR
jgi:hypothetical protein